MIEKLDLIFSISPLIRTPDGSPKVNNEYFNLLKQLLKLFADLLDSLYI